MPNKYTELIKLISEKMSSEDSIYITKNIKKISETCGFLANNINKFIDIVGDQGLEKKKKNKKITKNI